MSSAAADRPRRRVGVCLVSDPDLPADISERVKRDLPGLLDGAVGRRVEWEVRTVVTAIQVDEQISDSRLATLVDGMDLQRDGDIAVVITDMPRRHGLRPVAAEVSVDRRVALVSLPAFGFFRLYPRVRDAVVDVVVELSDEQRNSGGTEGTPGANRSRGSNRSGSRTVFGDPADDRLRRTALRRLGVIRMLGGMLRANRPWRLFLGLSRSVAGVFATAAYGVINVTAWRLAVNLGPIRQAALAVVAVGALMVWLIVDHELWERPDDVDSRAQARLYNVSTVLTLAVGVTSLYAELYVGIFLVQQLLLTPQVIQQSGSAPTGWHTHLAITWFLTSAAVVGGAVGSGFEEDSVVRRAAYGARQRERQQRRADAARK